jgi:hypothetical protein
MFGIFRRRETAERKTARREFESVIASLRSRSPVEQALVGHSINLANSVFVQRFGSVAKFAALPQAERLEYFASLQTMLEKLRTSGDREALAGFGLFRLWLWGASAPVTDAALQRQITQSLEELSRKGDAFKSEVESYRRQP